MKTQIEEVKKYKTEDGIEHDNLEAANKHVLKENLREHAYQIYSNESSIDITTFIVTNIPYIKEFIMKWESCKNNLTD